MPVTITKADGSQEFFKVEKLRRLKTQEIYRRAFDLLRDADQESPVAARYSLRRALFNLGPTGFPFEKFLGRLFEADGYTTTTGVILPGNCAEHEIDVAAYKEDHSFIAEAKFHARPGIKSDLQVAMYSYARFLDLKSQKICSADICGIREFWIITNTKFTSAARKYATCVGLPLLSWDYPRRDNLHDRIQRAGIYPVTVLQQLSANQVRTLIARDIILCSDIIKSPQVLKHLHLPKRKHEAIIAEAQSICNVRGHQD